VIRGSLFSALSAQSVPAIEELADNMMKLAKNKLGAFFIRVSSCEFVDRLLSLRRTSSLCIV
jgi:hypothetical protein